MRSRLTYLLIAGLAACGGGDDGGGDGPADGDGGPGDDGRVIDANTDGGQVSMPGSLRFFGTGGGIDRVEIPIDPQVPADVGVGDFTIDFWLRAAPRAAGGRPLPMDCSPGRDNWQAGEIVLDRDRMGGGDHGDFGVAIFHGGVAFGVSQGTTGTGVCGIIPVRSGWHHVAVTRNATTGIIALYVDGMPDGMNQGPTGNLSYRDGATGDPKDPFLVLGADKFDRAGSQSFDGNLDELRISTTVRYTAMFKPETARHAAVDADTAALYHFDEAGGNTLIDERGMSNGAIKVGEDANGGSVPLWSTAEPFLQ